MTDKVLNLNKEREVFWALVIVLVFFVGIYMYFVRTTIGNVVARQNFENESSALALSIGSQEFEYIAKRNTVTLAMAESLGFKESQTKAYISRNASTEVAYLSN